MSDTSKHLEIANIEQLKKGDDTFSLQKQAKICIYKSFQLDSTTKFFLSLNGNKPECLFSQKFVQFVMSEDDILMFMTQRNEWGKTALKLATCSVVFEQNTLILINRVDEMEPNFILSKEAVHKLKGKAKLIYDYTKTIIDAKDIIDIMFSIIIEKYNKQRACTPLIPLNEVARFVDSYTPMKELIKEFKQAISEKNLICNFNYNDLCMTVLSQKDFIYKKMSDNMK